MAPERVLCPCNRCKRGILRRIDISDEHIEDWGRWDESIVETQIREFATSRKIDPSLISPTWSRRSSISEASTGQGGHARRSIGGQEENSILDEPPPIEDIDMDEMIEAFYDVNDTDDDDEAAKLEDPTIESLRQLARTPIFEGSQSSILRACLSLLNLQSMYGWSDASVNALFKLMKTSLFPTQNKMPESRDIAKKILSDVGMDYNSIHACPNDCILYRGVHENLSKCPKCSQSRYRQDLTGTEVPAKVLRHFPIIPRISHMFKCPEIAKLMAWHSTSRSTDGVMRTPADSPAWQHIEEQWPEFRREPRHLRLGIATDGVNPFGLRSSSWSTWPVVLVNYNIPPWLTIKKGHLLLALIIPGKHKVKNMDVYLAPVVDELKVLWEGIEIQDVSKRRGHKDFNLRAILMWTMHDFPGYGECSGLATSGYYACPHCGPTLNARYSQSLKKMIYQGHKRYLPEGHSMRGGFLGRAPNTWTVLDQYNAWQTHPGSFGMKRLSIFHELPYWRKLLINHLLDPMHIFKNVGQILWEHLIGNRDNKKARDDLQEAQITHMQAYWPLIGEGNVVTLPKVPWILTHQEENRVKSVIGKFRTPTGHMHCLKGAFTKDNKLSGLKTHDWHKFLQYILPTAIDGCTTMEVRNVIYKISRLVRWISQKEIKKDSIQENKINAIEAVCMLEKYFPTSILTIQVHLMVHVVDEVAIAGVVNSRWMFFLERFMKTLKSFVRQRARPEGSMAEGWLVQESLVYISEFLGRKEDSLPLLWQNKEDKRMVGDVPQGKGKQCKMDSDLEEKINRFCILNHPAMEKWVDAFEVAKAENQRRREEYRMIHQQHSSTFQYPTELKALPKFITINWLYKAQQEAIQNGITVSITEREFAMGCSRRYKSYGAMWSYGRHFRIHRIDHNRQTCDSGVMASFKQEIQSTHNGDLQVSNIEYCGRIQSILEIDFRTFEMFLLDVQWFKAVTHGRNPTILRDASGFVAIDSTKLWTNKSDTLVLAQTCEQVMY